MANQTQSKHDEQPTRGRIAIRTSIRVVSAIIVGVLICEGLLRLLVPQPIFYSTWFTDGVHQKDSEFGFVFRPNYDGFMRNSDGVWSEPIQLNENGFRNSASHEMAGGGTQSTPMNVLMIGGASMAFSYGLSDDESLHQQIASQLSESNRIDLISWPGFTLAQDVHKLRRFSDPEKYDLAIVCAYGAADYQYQPNWESLPPPPEMNWLGSVVVPEGPPTGLFGSWYYKSRVVAGMARTADVPRRLMSKFVSSEVSHGNPVSQRDAPHSHGDPIIVSVANHLRRQGISQVLIVGLPAQRGVAGPESLPQITDPNIHWLDLRDESVDEESDFDWIASGHYGPRAAARLATEIAAKLNP